MEETRKSQEEQMIESAEKYFAEHGLTASFEVFFRKESTQAAVHEGYTLYEKVLTDTIDSNPEMPEFLQSRARRMMPQFMGMEEDYAKDVKTSMMCSVFELLLGMECYIPVGDYILNSFKAAFERDGDERMLGSLIYVCQESTKLLLNYFFEQLRLPENVPEDLQAALLMLSGGGTMMSFEEIFGMDIADDADESESSHSVHECSCGDNCKCQKNHNQE